MTVIGSRKRGYINAEGSKVKLVIRRLKCKRCVEIHHELPDILVPYKRHSSETVEQIVDEKTEDVSCEDSTIRKIKRWYINKEQYFTGCLVSVAARHGAALAAGTISLLRKMRECSGWLRRLVRIVVNSNLWLHTRSEYLPK